MSRVSLMIVGAVGLVVATLGAVWIGARRQQSALSAQLDRLREAGIARAAVAGRDVDSLETVPAPVARYLRRVLRTTNEIQEVQLRQIGTLRADLNSDRWMPFVAEHIVVPPATGFVWNARIKVAPLLHVRVTDSLSEGRGAGQVSLLSALTVSAAADTPEMNSGSLHRYLAEAVWYPSALLPGPNLRWDAIDETRALASTLTRNGGPSGRVALVRTKYAPRLDEDNLDFSLPD